MFYQVELKNLRRAILRLNWLRPDGFSANDLANAAMVGLKKTKDFLAALEAEGFVTVVGGRVSKSGRTSSPTFALSPSGRKRMIDEASSLRKIIRGISHPGSEVLLVTVTDLESAVEQYENEEEPRNLGLDGSYSKARDKLRGVYADYDAVLDVSPELAGELRDRADACLARINAVIRRRNPKAPGIRLD